MVNGHPAVPSGFHIALALALASASASAALPDPSPSDYAHTDCIRPPARPLASPINPP